jgi:hypothetical protein
LDVDSGGNLYVAEEYASTINVYAPGATTATTVLSDTNGYPYGVAHCADGTTYVANEGTASGYGNIVYYYPNQTVPSGAIPDSNIGIALSVSCDKNSNVYAEYADNVNYNVQIVEYGPQGSSMSNTGDGAYLGDIGAVRVANDGQLAISDRSDGQVLSFNTKSPAGTAPIHTSRFGVLFFGFSLGASEDDIYGAAYSSDARIMGCARKREGCGGPQNSPQPGTVFRANANNLRLVKSYGLGVLQGPFDAFVFPGGNS